MKVDVSNPVGELTPCSVSEAPEVGTQMKDQTELLVSVGDLVDSRLDLRDEIVDGEVSDGTQADASVRKLLDRFNHAARLGPSPSVVSEGDRESWPGRPTTLGDAVLPFVLAGTTHHQQVAVSQPPGE